MLTNLKELDLSMNLYTQMPDQLLWKDSHLATSLTKLSINQNRIQVLPDDIQEMKSLQVPFSSACAPACGAADGRVSGWVRPLCMCVASLSVSFVTVVCV